MRSITQLFITFVFIVIQFNYALAQNTTMNGRIELEQRLFLDDSIQNPEEIDNYQTSFVIELEWLSQWNNGDDQIVFVPFYRLDSQDDERQHGDIRELLWTHYASDWQFSAGIGKVFWGVTESQHLVDIINQTDAVENIDGEDKLGQPMLQYSKFTQWGDFEIYALPYFRERTFTDKDQRLSGGIFVNPDDQQYESSSERNHLDFALRWSRTIADWGIGLSWFNGTSREPDLTRFFDPNTKSTIAYYPQINQVGADIQLTTDAWLFKLEAIRRNFSDNAANQFLEDFNAATVGTEYTFVGVFDSIYDIGALAEYSYDSRDALSTTGLQNDVFIGARLAFNDIGASEILLGLSTDLDKSNNKAVFIEGSKRVADNLTCNIELRYFEADNPSGDLYGLRNDSVLQLGLEYFF